VPERRRAEDDDDRPRPARRETPPGGARKRAPRQDGGRRATRDGRPAPARGATGRGATRDGRQASSRGGTARGRGRDEPRERGGRSGTAAARDDARGGRRDGARGARRDVSARAEPGRTGFGPHATHAAAAARRGSPSRRSGDERDQVGKKTTRARDGRARVRVVRGRSQPASDQASRPARRGRRRPAAIDAGTARARPGRRRRGGPADVREEILRLGGRTGERAYQRLLQAADDFADDRARDALRILRPLRDSLPESPTVRELLGLSLYRVGRYADAAKELEAYHAMTGEVTQHPVLMDCARALGDERRVDELWRELAEASPSAELVTEGRIVRAATLADAGRLDAALAQLRGRATSPKRVREHHLRLWYALADLEERAGNLAAARTLFQRIRSHDPAFADVAERLAALG